MSGENFELASEEITNFFKNGGDTNNDNKLALYKFFKQGSVGDCDTKKPGGINPFSKDKAKWEAWNSVKGMSKDDAKVEYVKLAKTILPEATAKNL